MKLIFSILALLIATIALSEQAFASKSGPIEVSDGDNNNRGLATRYTQESLQKIENGIKSFCKELDESDDPNQKYKCDSFKNNKQDVYRVDVDQSKKTGDLIVEITVAPLFLKDLHNVTPEIKKVDFEALRIKCRIDDTYNEVTSYIDLNQAKRNGTLELTDNFKKTMKDCINKADEVSLAD